MDEGISEVWWLLQDLGDRPCQSNRDQIHAWLVTTDKVRQPWDGRYHRIFKVLNCTTPNLIYYLVCSDCPGRPGVTPSHITPGPVSEVGVKKRISSHKSDMSRGAGKDRGFCEHWATFHRGWMVPLGSLASLDPVAGMNKRDDARAGARNWGI